MKMTLMTLLVLLQAEVGSPGEGISPGALAFMLISMGSVALLTAWCFLRIMKTRRHFDPDGTGPAKPPVPGEAEGRGRA
jgi:hypothetical protein